MWSVCVFSIGVGVGRYIVALCGDESDQHVWHRVLHSVQN